MELGSIAPKPPGSLDGSYCSSWLADAGARVIKIERPKGDFARRYDAAVHGSSSYFVWLNRGKQSLIADIQGLRRRCAAAGEHDAAIRAEFADAFLTP